MMNGINLINAITEYHGSSKWHFKHSRIVQPTHAIIDCPDKFSVDDIRISKRKRATVDLPSYIVNGTNNFFVRVRNNEQNSFILIERMKNNQLKISIKSEYGWSEHGSEKNGMSPGEKNR
jgi:hypothetical protein